MTSLNSIFREILLTFDSITVPNFGTFETSYKSAQLDEKSGMIYPPTKLVVFSEEKKEDKENRLSAYLVEKLKISSQEADKLISDFVSEAQSKFKENASLTIDEVGVMSKDENGVVVLKSVPSNLSIDNYGMDAVEVEKVDESKRVTPVVSLGKTASSKSTKTTTTKVTTVKTSTVKTEEKTQEKKKNSLLKLLAIILPIVALLTILFFIFKDSILGCFGGKNNDKQTSNTEDTAVSRPDVQVIDIEEPQTVEIKENLTTDSDLNILARAGFSNVSPQYLGSKYKKYYLVGGSFRDKSNANRIKHQISAKEILKAEGSEYYRVIIIGSDDAQEIVDAYQQALSKGIKADDMWLLKNSK